MTVKEAIGHLDALKGSLDHPIARDSYIALHMAIAVLKALLPEDEKVVDTLYESLFV